MRSIMDNRINELIVNVETLVEWLHALETRIAALEVKIDG